MTDTEIHSLTILGGRDKHGREEEFSITCSPGDIVCLVGPTGSGKSRFLGDIECLARGDTASGRQVLVNGSPADDSGGGPGGRKLVAQLSQQMNFIVDLSVGDFLRLHAGSRLVPDADADGIVRTILDAANSLAGETFTGDTPVTQLSGGQSRALMIADVALLSPCPVVLIDEIENAGINRMKALDLLVREEKITFIATHDPLLALMGSRRIWFRDGGVAGIVVPDEEERRLLPLIRERDGEWMRWREQIRSGSLLRVGAGTGKSRGRK